MRLALVVLLVFPSLGMMCGPIPPPEPDSCSDPAASPVAGLQIGPDQASDLPFDAWAATDTATITRGIQGGDMLGVTFHVTGAPPPACLPQRTRLSVGGRVLESKVPLHTYGEPDGARQTQTLWLIFDQAPAIGSVLELQTEAGGQTLSRQLTVAAERHRLVSLTAKTANPWVGAFLDFEIVMHHAPAYGSVELTLTSTDTSVVSAPFTPLEVYGNHASFQVNAVGPGTAELVVQLGDQELRTAVTVEP